MHVNGRQLAELARMVGEKVILEDDRIYEIPDTPVPVGKSKVYKVLNGSSAEITISENLYNLACCI